jgi:hypothetical protein
MRLTDQQLQHFRTFGYLMLPGIFSSREMNWITEEFETAIRAYGKGAAHDGSSRTMFGAPIERSDKLCALLDDSRTVGIFSGILGPDFNYCGGDGNYFTGDTGWHADGNWGRLFGVKLVFYLDPLTRATGCLRVLPGSQDPDHFVRKHSINPSQSQELFGVAPRDIPGNVALETTPGDVVFFDHDTFHASWGGGTRRRMFTINCIQHCKTESELALARRYLSVHVHRIVQRCGYDATVGAGMYSPLMIETADEQRRAHLAQPIQIYDELFPQFARRY